MEEKESLDRSREKARSREFQDVAKEREGGGGNNCDSPRNSSRGNRASSCRSIKARRLTSGIGRGRREEGEPFQSISPGGGRLLEGTSFFTSILLLLLQLRWKFVSFSLDVLERSDEHEHGAQNVPLVMLLSPFLLPPRDNEQSVRARKGTRRARRQLCSIQGGWTRGRVTSCSK